MTEITTRAGKGAPLTHDEVDQNFLNLQETADLAYDAAASIGGKVNATAVGVDDSAADMGTTPGTILSDNGTAKGWFSEMESAVQDRAPHLFDFMSAAQQADFLSRGGAQDHTAAMIAAVADGFTTGEVIWPRGQANISSTLDIGDGNGLATVSTKQGLRFRAPGGGFGVSGANVPIILNYIGTPTTNPLINIKGAISGIELGGMLLNLNGNCAGITATAFTNCEFGGIKIVGPASNTAALKIMGGGAPTGNYNIFNSFKQIHGVLTQPNSIGLLMDGNYGAINDTWLSSFDVCRFEPVTGANNSIAAKFAFVDSVSFRRCHFLHNGVAGCVGAVFDAMNNHQYPAGMAFYDCSIQSHSIVEDASHKIRHQYFYGFGTLDLETVPTDPRFVGFTDTGAALGGMSLTPGAGGVIGYAAGAGGTVTQATSKGTAVTLNKRVCRITLNNSALAAGAFTPFVFNNNLIGPADQLSVQIVGGTSSYGNYTATVEGVGTGYAVLGLRNVSGGSLSEAVVLQVMVLAGQNL